METILHWLNCNKQKNWPCIKLSSFLFNLVLLQYVLFYHNWVHPFPCPQDTSTANTPLQSSSDTNWATKKKGQSPTSWILGIWNFWSLISLISSIVIGSSWGPTSWPMSSQPKRLRMENFMGWVHFPTPLPPGQVYCHTYTSPYSQGEKNDFWLYFEASKWEGSYGLLRTLKGQLQDQ
jgi:hypothetical protein